jgi:hypothetical protein
MKAQQRTLRELKLINIYMFQVLPHREHALFFTNTNQLMQFRKIIVTICNNNAKQEQGIYIEWQNIYFLNITVGGMYSYHGALSDKYGIIKRCLFWRDDLSFICITECTGNTRITNRKKWLSRWNSKNYRFWKCIPARVLTSKSPRSSQRTKYVQNVLHIHVSVSLLQICKEAKKAVGQQLIKVNLTGLQYTYRICFKCFSVTMTATGWP